MQRSILSLSLVLGLVLVAWWAMGGAESAAGVVAPDASGAVESPAALSPPELAPDLEVPGDPAVPEPLTAEGSRKPAPIEACELELHLVHHLTGAPIEARVQVWQLDVPADATWKAGDRKVLDETAQGGVIALKDLPAGTYRAHVPQARAGSPMPPAFEVRTARVVQDWPVVPAEAEPMWLEVFDQYGARVDVALERDGSRWSFRGHGSGDPDWANERQLQDPGETQFGLGGRVGGRSSVRGKSWRLLERDRRGLSLRTLLQDTRLYRRTHSFSLRRAGGGDGPAQEIQLQPGGHQDFVTVLVERDLLAPSLIVPPGGDPDELLAKLKLSADCVAHGPEAGRGLLEAWREVRVTVSLNEAGYLPLKLTWQPGLEPTPELLVRRRPAEGL